MASVGAWRMHSLKQNSYFGMENFIPKNLKIRPKISVFYLCYKKFFATDWPNHPLKSFFGMDYPYRANATSNNYK